MGKRKPQKLLGTLHISLVKAETALKIPSMHTWAINIQRLLAWHMGRDGLRWKPEPLKSIVPVLLTLVGMWTD